MRIEFKEHNSEKQKRGNIKNIIIKLMYLFFTNHPTIVKPK